MAAPVAVDRRTGASSTSQLSIDVSTMGVQAGDLLVAAIQASTNAQAGTPPAGFVAIHTGPTAAGGGSGSGWSVSAWYKVADGAETTLTWTGATLNWLGVVTRVAGADTSDPLSGTAVKGDSSFGTTATCPALTAAVADSLAFRVIAKSSSTATVAGMPSGHATEYQDASATTPLLGVASLAYASTSIPAASFTLSAGDGVGVLTFAIRPAPAGGAATPPIHLILPTWHRPPSLGGVES